MSFKASDRLAFGQYLRLEERFQFSESKGNSFGMRLRYQVTGVIRPKRHFFREESGVYFPMEAEIFFNIKKTSQFNDVLRLSPGIGYQINHGFRLQAAIAYHYVQDEAGQVAKSNDLIYKFKIYKTLNFDKKNPETKPNEPSGEPDFRKP